MVASCFCCRQPTVGEALQPFQIRVFSPQQLKRATKHYHQDHKLGEGGFGSVYKGALEDGQEIAVKKLSDSNKNHANTQFKAEVNTISSVRHRNLIRLLGYCVDRDNKYLIYEYLENLSLDKHLFANKGQRMSTLSWYTRQKIIKGTANGLSYLHHDLNDRIVHRDIKAANILLDKGMEAKIADFGLARLYPSEQTHHSTLVAGTIGYLAPEVLKNGQITERSDTYSFGVVVLEILSGRKVIDASVPSDRRNLLDWAWVLYQSGRHTDLMDPLLNGGYKREEVSQLIRLALMCTQTMPEERPTMRDVVLILESKMEGSVIGTPRKPENVFTRDVSQVQTSESIESSGSEFQPAALYLKDSLELYGFLRPAAR